MSLTNASPHLDREALAEQVIVSAGNILATAGFSREEIGDFFRQAAEQLQTSTDRVPTTAPKSDSHLARVATEFSRNPAVHELHALSAKAGALQTSAPNGEDLRNAFDMAMQAVPLIAEAQHALRTLAAEASLALVNRHDTLDGGAACVDQSEQAGTICLDDFETLYADAIEIVGVVADALARDGDREAFAFLLGHLADNGVMLNSRLQAAFEEGARTLG